MSIASANTAPQSTEPASTAPASTAPASTENRTGRRVLQRLVMPLDKDVDVLPLYVDPDPIALDADRYDIGGESSAVAVNNATIRQKVASGETIHPDQITGRHQIRVNSGEQLSFGTYFNGFPAGYWRRWTVVEEVRLTVRLVGAGAAVTVYRSMANGRSQRADAAQVTGDSGTFTFDLPLQPFVDGGWYWFDVTAGDLDVEVEATWDAEVPADRLEVGSLAIAITTMNRPEFCSELLAQLAGDEGVKALLDRVYVMEQGTQKVIDAEAYPAARDALGDKLTMIEQGNLGGSGGYARGQLEIVQAGTAKYSMMVDDDVVCEPEGIIRAVTFADLTKTPTIVGGHMFSLYDRSRLHSLGEVVSQWNFWWHSPSTVFNDWDFSARNLRSSRWLHRRVDVDFNGWFMCLIPTEVLREIGLSLPLFIKWDDSEYGLRARQAGYPTVSFPGAAVWHIPWTDKNDGVDWQSYFHQRNRFVAALLHSPYEHGGRLVWDSWAHQVKHIASMQYSTAELRLMALEDLLAGPDRLHEELATKLPQVNAYRKQFTDAVLEADVDSFPPVRRSKLKKGGRDEFLIPHRRARLMTAALAPLRQLKKPRALSREYPEAAVAGMDAFWYRLVGLDSAIVSMKDGTSAALYQRDPEKFKDLVKRSTALHKRFYAEWPQLAEQYRDALGRITSPDAWEETFRPWTAPTEPIRATDDAAERRTEAE